MHAPPLRDQWGVHHSKAFLVHFERGLRVIVMTANLIYQDCNTKTQGLWYQDFPRCAGPSVSPLEQCCAATQVMLPTNPTSNDAELQWQG